MHRIVRVIRNVSNAPVISKCAGKEFTRTPLCVIEGPPGNSSRDETDMSATFGEFRSQTRIPVGDGSHLLEHVSRKERIIDRAQ